MKVYTYLLIDVLCMAAPLAASFYPKHAFYKSWKYFIPANLFVAALFLIWDAAFTAWGVWGFSENYISGIYLYNLPLEEVLFFICVPYACVFTYFAFEYLLPKNPLDKFQHKITYFLIFLLLTTGVLYLDRAYTATTFFITTAYLIYNLVIARNLASTYFSYLAILPFFFISNGILTGSFIENPIVWYNNEENLGIRIVTIPVEDIFYGFLLIALNIELFERFRKADPTPTV
jgi:lycopene cyclase domain-containing protein